MIVVPLWLKERRFQEKEEINDEVKVEPVEPPPSLEKLILIVKNSESEEEIIQAKDDFLVYFTPFPKKESEYKISNRSKKHFEFLENLFTTSVIKQKERKEIMEDIRKVEKSHKVEIGFMWRRLNQS